MTAPMFNRTTLSWLYWGGEVEQIRLVRDMSQLGAKTYMWLTPAFSLVE